VSKLKKFVHAMI